MEGASCILLFIFYFSFLIINDKLLVNGCRLSMLT